MDPAYPKWIQPHAWARLRVDDDPVVLENELRAMKSDGVLRGAGTDSYTMREKAGAPVGLTARRSAVV